MLGLGGEYEGFTVVIQGDNAGPHGENEYMTFITEHCERKG
jgi:hypothetical protein